MGLYSFLEDKWYDILEKVDKFVPILKVTDKIDEYIPSFALFLVIIILLLIVALWSELFIQNSAFDVELTIQTKQGQPIGGAVVTFSQVCDSGEEKSLTLQTNEAGKAFFFACSESANVSVQKEKYFPLSQELIFTETKVTLSLSPLITSAQKNFFAKVVDNKGKLISGAGLELICIAEGKPNKTIIQSSSTGFNFDLPAGCTSIQLRGFAQGYEEKTVTLSSKDESKTITLKEKVSKGTAIFYASCPAGILPNAQITLTDELDRDQTVLLNAQAQASVDLEEGTYTYSAFANGVVVNGSFSIKAGEVKDVQIFFDSITSLNGNDSNVANNVFIKVVNNSSPIVAAEVKLFISKGTDMNLIVTQQTDIFGVYGPTPVNDINATYYASIKAKGFQTKVVLLNKLRRSASPQIVELLQGGAKLKINIIDDLNKPVVGASTKLFNSSFKGYFDKEVSTDKNGVVIYSGLPAGTYSVRANTSATEGFLDNIQITTLDKEVTLVLITSQGYITFGFMNDANAIVPQAQLQKRFSVFEKAADIRTSTFKTLSYFVGADLRIISDYNKYFPYEGFVYDVKKTSQKKTIFQIAPEELSNNNLVQMKLRRIYDSNPITGDERESNRILAGKTYYALFDFIINTSGTANAYVNFYSGKKDTNDTNGMYLNDAYSIDSSTRLLSSRYIASAIEEAYNPIVDSNAKQINVLLGNQTGPRQIPVLVEIVVSPNASDTLTLNFEGFFGTNQSLTYSKEFKLGEQFCLGANCPPFLFSNYIKRNDGAYSPVDDGVNILQIGDNYTIKSIAKNTTDKDYGEKSLVLSLDSGALVNVAFNPDNNFLSRQISLAPLSDANYKEYLVITKTPSAGNRSIYEAVLDTPRAINNIESQYAMRMKVKNKEQLQIVVVAESEANVLYEGANYGFVVVKTRYSNNSNAKTIWKAYVISATGEQIPLQQGATDSNGMSVTTLNLTSIARDTNILFIADDDNGSLQARQSIIVTPGIADEIKRIPSCIKVTLNNKPYDSATNAYTTIDVTEKAIVKVTSECAETARVNIETDLSSMPMMQFELAAGAEQALTLDPATTVIVKNGMLGAYPVGVSSIVGTNKFVEHFDVIVKDKTSCFDLNEAIYDLKSVEQVAGVINNKCFNGRLDNFYPKLNAATESVRVTFKKPGNLENIDFNATVIGSAIESQVQCGASSNVLNVLASGNAGPRGAVLPGSVAKELNFGDEFTSYCEQAYYDGNYIEKPEPDLNITNPTIPMYRMPVVSDYTASRVSTQANKKQKRIDFATVSLGSQVDSNLFPVGTYAGLNGTMNPGLIDVYGPITSLGAPYPAGGYLINYYWDAASAQSLKFDPAYPENSMKKYVPTNNTVYNGFDLTTPQRWYAGAPFWNGKDESIQTKYVVLASGGPHNPQNTRGASISEAKNFIQQYVQGYQKKQKCGKFWCLVKIIIKPVWMWDFSASYDDQTSQLETQFETLDRYVPFTERRIVWTKEVHLKTTEGVVQDLGRYSTTVTPAWTNITTWDNKSKGLKVGDTSVGANSAFQVIGLHNNGLVAPETIPGAIRGCVLGDTVCEANLAAAQDGNINWIIRPAEDPLVEYDSTGRVMYYVPQNTIPGYAEGTPYVRTFLKNQHMYAEYIGLPEIAGSNIDFNIKKINLLGQEYAVITVQDWVKDASGNLIKQAKAFQIKLNGNSTNCFATDGTPGTTGKEFAPKLFFNWDWNGIGYNQCDTTNDASTYCDGTQFTISLFQRINKINDLFLANKRQEVPKYASFYAYMVKDNYSQAFLDDFDEYYSSVPFTGASFFNSTGTSMRFDKFIENKTLAGNNRIQFFFRDENGNTQSTGQLPKPGIYRVELGFALDNENAQALLTPEGPNAVISVTFKFEQAPKNNNPFYETPFDGMVGKKGSTFARANYGVSLIVPERQYVPLTSTIKLTETYTNAFKTIWYNLIENPLELNNGFVINYSKADNTLRFYPSKPIPVLATIQNTQGGRTKLAYMIEGLPIGTTVPKEWMLNDSTIGADGCTDFDNKVLYVYSDINLGGSIREINWTGTKSGAMKLSTVFFMPLNYSPSLNFFNKGDILESSFKTYPEITSAGGIQLTNNLAGYAPSTILEVFNSIANEQMCISQNSVDELKIWWNKEYLNSLVEKINDGSFGRCAEK